MISKLAQSIKLRFAASARNRRRAYREFIESENGKLILTDLVRGSGILSIDESVSMEDSIRILSRWYPIASILNGAAMTDEQIASWAEGQAVKRAEELERAAFVRENSINNMER